ncbi:ABC transporter substrate-binding protein [Bradyrhizobium arachidis]|uniref:ABC transporter substrate-binding protein n=1 Tax=Bradyrhizobium arachidis TaxID=858423 RepID=A0AAE7NQ48_9BRAD|nr:ABC transporter substrate-binding protein [Bradyrhizobium arachidis]QOZ69062.1 ABC transporter substrate-binding protein [Bradyrhizobium arachidis]SFV00254.1 NitT/TauT family transport system substrate-binding protein [Bradyrhizobium arachidis]
MSIREPSRRQLLRRGAALAVASVGLAAPAIAQARTKLRLGYLHVVAVDGHIWTGLDRGSFDREGIDFELHEFNTGPEVFEAMMRGELEVVSAGGVISNYLALGRGRGFLINDIEVATAQLWGRPSLGVTKLADLRGKRIATTMKTTAHIFLDRALRANSINPSEVEIVNSSMPDAVGAFIAGEVPAVALWVPFNVAVREALPEAVKLVDASAFYPQSAVLGGWAARTDYYAGNKEVLSRIIRGWVDANDHMVRNPAAAAEALQAHYRRSRPADLTEAFKAQKLYSAREWRRLYADGTVAKWLQQVSDFFMTDAGVTNAVRASDYFDTQLYLAAVG